jgi:arylsulfatase
VFPKPVTAPANAPNVVLVLLDDVGFGQFGTFGGATPTPELDKLASDGLRYNRFHTTAICSPTRAALLTGRNHHVAATGGIAESATGYDGYVMTIPKRTGMMAEVLRQNGYTTAWIGKNHNTPPWEISPRGPFDNWPTAWGFEYFYGFMGGQTSQWDPMLFENHSLVSRSADPNYHLTTDLVDHALNWVDSVQAVPGKTILCLFCAGRHACASSRAEGVDRSLQRQVRRRLGQISGGNIRAAEDARRGSRGCQAHAASERDPGLGYAGVRSEEGRSAHDGGLRRFHRAHGS